MFSITVDLTDQWVTPVYEHVHHGRCFDLFEEARIGLLRAIGFPNDMLLGEGKALVIAKVEATYKREVKKGLVTVTCEDIAIDGRTLIVHQKIVNARGKVAVDARIESVFMDMNTRRGMDIPEDFKIAFLGWAKG
jgi:YbgC/YbaW family acyl-CoA thioester hydrolase